MLWRAPRQAVTLLLQSVLLLLTVLLRLCMRNHAGSTGGRVLLLRSCTGRRVLLLLRGISLPNRCGVWRLVQ